MDYLEYCGFQYSHSELDGYMIIPDYKVEKPPTFYKYYALTDYNVEALTNMYVYATHPKLFNDPFDCNENLIEFNTWKDVERLCGGLFEKVKEAYPLDKAACEFCNRAYWNILYKKLGLVSLATQCDNYLMWTLYTQNKGFCVEYDVDKFPFTHHGPFPMNYTKRIPGPLKIGDVGGYIAMLVQTNVKNEWWSYEKEWRLYIPNPAGLYLKQFGDEYEMKFYNTGDEHDRKFKYSIEALKSVTLGPMFFDKLISNPISAAEFDIYCHPFEEKKRYDTLKFLSEVTNKVALEVKYAKLSGFSHCEFLPIKIVEYAEGKFRIIFLSSSMISNSY